MVLFKITENNDKHVITFANLVEAIYLTIYTWSIEIKYYQGLELIGREFIKYLIER